MPKGNEYRSGNGSGIQSAVLVGGTGFIGRALSEALRARDVRVHVVDRSVHDVRTPLGAPPPACDVLFHLAQSPHYRDFPAQSRDLFQTNLFSLNEYCVAAIERARLVVFFSSGSVFGRSAELVQPDTVPSPEGFYAFTKWAGELCLRQYASYYATLVVRPFQPYGPGQADRLLPRLAERIAAEKPVRLNPSLRLSFLHVRDLAELVLAASERALAERAHAVFNAASPEVVSLEDVARLLAHGLDRPLELEWEPEGPTNVVAADSSDLYAYAGLRPRIGLREGIAEFARAFLAART